LITQVDITCLKETEHGGNDTHETGSGGGNEHAVGRARLSGLGATARAGTAGARGLSTGTGELATDLAAEGLEGGAVARDVVGGRDAEGTIDLVQVGNGDAVVVLVRGRE
jgi:hypothetical protein